MWETQLVDLLHQMWPVANGTVHGATVDVAVRRGSPFSFNIIDFEGQVRWDAKQRGPLEFSVMVFLWEGMHAQVGLNRAEVVSNDFGGGILICKLNRPNTCACADVKYALRIGPDGSEMKLAAQTEVAYVVIEIKAI